MQILIDADTMLEVLLDRGNDSQALFALLESGHIQGYLSEFGLYYKIYGLTGYLKDVIIAAEIVDDLAANKNIEICLLNGPLLEEARLSPLKDFESAIEVVCATTMELDAILTHKVSDFVDARLPVLSVREIPIDWEQIQSLLNKQDSPVLLAINLASNSLRKSIENLEICFNLSCEQDKRKKAFTQNKSLFASVHEARQRLEHFTIPNSSEKFYPGVMSLPTLCVTPSALNQQLIWKRLKKPSINPSLLLSQLPGIAISCLVSLIGFYAFYRPTFTPPSLKPITINGSSTVYPITNKIALEFLGTIEDKPQIDVGISGTGGGFKKFCRGETDINNASRQITLQEKKLCQENGVTYIKLPIAYDALTVVVNRDNNWFNEITFAELKRLWELEAEGKVTQWNHIRTSFPAQPLKLYGLGSDSGTFDYFTKIIVGQEGVSRKDYIHTEYEWEVVLNVINNREALAYFGFSYYAKYESRLKALAIRNGNKAVLPSIESVNNGSYPLSRVLFIYVNTKKAKNRPELREFIDYYLTNAKDSFEEANYIPLRNKDYQNLQAEFQRQVKN